MWISGEARTSSRESDSERRGLVTLDEDASSTDSVCRPGVPTVEQALSLDDGRIKGPVLD